MDPNTHQMNISKEMQQLEEIAKISRCHLAFERKTLEALSMMCIFKNASILHNSVTHREQFKFMPPVLRRDFLRRLEASARHRNTGFKGGWSEAELERVFSLVRLLLDKAITEFDFVVFGMTFRRDQETRRLLAKMCPNLTRVMDSRNRTGVARNGDCDFVLHLLKLKKLEHINLQTILFTDKDVALLAESFPDLRSLEFLIKHKHINDNFQCDLFKLQKLEMLTVGLFGFSSPEDKKSFQISELHSACIQHLPALQFVHVLPWEAHRPHFLNSKLDKLDRPLALRTLAIKEGFRGWTSEQLPRVTRLYLEGPLRDVKEFLGFRNLSSLELCDVAPVDTELILKSCRFRLEELKLSKNWIIEDISQIDAYQVFILCPKLYNLSWSGDAGLSRSDLFPVSTGNFVNLRYVLLIFRSDWFPSNLLAQIFMAPHLESLAIYDFNLDVPQIQDLTERLMRKEILQSFLYFSFDYSGGCAAVDEALVRFLKLLPCYTPRLEKISFEEKGRWQMLPNFVKQVNESHIFELRVPDFQLVID